MHKTIIDRVSVMCPDTGGGSTVIAFPRLEASAPTAAKASARKPAGAANPATRGLVLNKATTRKLACPAGKAEHLYRDSEVRGFILRCYANGRRMWLVQYRDSGGATRRVNIGDAAVIEADDARAKARDLLADVTKGASPAEKRNEARKAAKFGDYVEAYLNFIVDRQKPDSVKEARRNLVSQCSAMHATRVDAVTRASIAELHDRISAGVGKVKANRVLATISAYFSWLMARGVIEMNPAIKIPRNVEKPREKCLTDDELRAIWRATASGSDHHRIVRLLLLTGARRSEVGSMRWSEINSNLWTVPGERMKNGLPHEIPLTEMAYACLPPLEEGVDHVFGKLKGSGFSGWSRAKERLDKGAGISNWGLHDFRRTMSTRLHESDIMPHVVEALLAHISGHKAGVAGVYNRASYRDQKRQALEAWSRMIGKVVGD